MDMRLFCLLFGLFFCKNGYAQSPVVILKEPYTVVEKIWVLRDTMYSKSPDGKLQREGRHHFTTDRWADGKTVVYRLQENLVKNPRDTALSFRMPIEKTILTVHDDTTGFADYGHLDLLADLTDDIDSTLRFFENSVAEDFIGHEIDGTEHILSDQIGRVMLVNFCGEMRSPQLSNTMTLNHLREDYPLSRLRMLTMTTWEEIDVRWRMKDLEVKPTFPVIPNGRNFMEHNFGGGLGLPRLVVIDKKGVIRKIILGADPLDPEAVYRRVKPILEELLKE